MYEIDRIESNVSGEKPSGITVTMLLSTSNPTETLDKVVSVLIVVLSALRSEVWPEDSWWQKHLPEWFMESFNHSLEEIVKDESLWDFGSWVDAAKYRGWEWWSSETSAESLKIYIEAYDDPYVIEPFEYIVKVSGGRAIELIDG